MSANDSFTSTTLLLNELLRNAPNMNEQQINTFLSAIQSTTRTMMERSIEEQRVAEPLLRVELTPSQLLQHIHAIQIAPERARTSTENIVRLNERPGFFTMPDGSLFVEIRHGVLRRVYNFDQGERLLEQRRQREEIQEQEQEREREQEQEQEHNPERVVAPSMRREPQHVDVRSQAQLRPAAAQLRETNFHLQSTNKKRSIGRARFEANCKNVCAICLDTHANGESIVTDCGHDFGQLCWQTWILKPGSNRTCPTCRKHAPHTISFTLRPDKKQNNNNTNNSQQPMQIF